MHALTVHTRTHAYAQVYIEGTAWKLGTRRTSRLLRMFIHNTTLYDIEEGGVRRDTEITSAIAEVGSWQCWVVACLGSLGGGYGRTTGEVVQQW